MANQKMGCAIFAIAAVILAMSTMNVFNKESFTDVGPTQNVVPRYTGANSLSSAQALENYQDRVVMNVGTSVEDVNKAGAQYYTNLQNYLNPSIDNLELAQNISSRPIMAGVPLPGAQHFYKNDLGDGFVDNLGHLGGNVFPSVSYRNDRAAQLSQCAKDLPMFAASSLLPKPSVNANNNALSQSAARAQAPRQRRDERQGQLRVRVHLRIRPGTHSGGVEEAAPRIVLLDRLHLDAPAARGAARGGARGGASRGAGVRPP